MTDSTSPDFGHRLLHVTIDEIAEETPDRTWASIPKSNNLSEGYRDVSFAMFANAINRLSWFLKSNLGPGLTRFRTVAYIGLPDMRYHVMSMAAAKTQLKVSKLPVRSLPSIRHACASRGIPFQSSAFSKSHARSTCIPFTWIVSVFYQLCLYHSHSSFYNLRSTPTYMPIFSQNKSKAG